MNALVMYDNQTDSLWSQFTGEAVEGPLKGISLEFIPSQLITWGAWRDLHPDTLALEKVPYGDFGYESGDDWEQQQQQQVNPTGDPYFAYYHTDARGVIGEANPDDRLYAKEMIVGIAGALTHRAYSYRDLREHPVINDILEGNSHRGHRGRRLACNRRVRKQPRRPEPDLRAVHGRPAADDRRRDWHGVAKGDRARRIRPDEGVSVKENPLHGGVLVRLDRLQPGNGALQASVR